MAVAAAGQQRTPSEGTPVLGTATGSAAHPEKPSNFKAVFVKRINLKRACLILVANWFLGKKK